MCTRSVKVREWTMGDGRGGQAMTRVKTFSSEIKIFHTMSELNDLDEEVNRFVEESGAKRIVSVSDTCTTGDTGATIGIIRAIAYE